jgi:hypothetical protein
MSSTPLYHPFHPWICELRSTLTSPLPLERPSRTPPKPSLSLLLSPPTPFAISNACHVLIAASAAHGLYSHDSHDIHAKTLPVLYLALYTLPAERRDLITTHPLCSHLIQDSAQPEATRACQSRMRRSVRRRGFAVLRLGNRGCAGPHLCQDVRRDAYLDIVRGWYNSHGDSVGLHILRDDSLLLPKILQHLLHSTCRRRHGK